MRTHLSHYDSAPEGIPISTLAAAFEYCVGKDYAIQAVPGYSYQFDLDTAMKRLSDVNEILAFWYDGGREYADEEICVLAKGWSGAYFVIEAGSDSTGWGCRQSMRVAVAGSEEEAVRLGMSKKYRIDLGYEEGEENR